VSTMRAMVRAGLGVSILPCYTADPDPGLRRIDPAPLIDSRFDMWVLYHPNAPPDPPAACSRNSSPTGYGPISICSKADVGGCAALTNQSVI
jgi:hypothetical protein